MELEEALFRWAATQPALTAILGVSPAPFRVYLDKVEQGAPMPSTVIQRNGAPRGYRYCGRDGAQFVTLQLDHYAKTRLSSRGLARVWKDALDPYPSPYPRWLVGTSNADGVRVKSVEFLEEFGRDVPEPGLLTTTQFVRFCIWEP